MPDVVGVVFHNGGKVYSYGATALELARGDVVVVPTQRGVELAEVVAVSADVPKEELGGQLKDVVRKASEADLEAQAANAEVRREAMAACRRLIVEHRLDMKLVDAEVLFGGGKIVFSFFAEERVDFRALVSDLARTLKTRIELRQIGAREEARVVGGLGPCGRGLCCTLFQGDQEPVSIRMAKEQSLPLNPMKISGLCGRLMCCLKYEQQQYVDFRKAAPRCGTPVQCSQGDGVVIGYQVPKDTLTVRLADGSIVDEPASGCRCDGAPCIADDRPGPDEAVAGAAGEPAAVSTDSAEPGASAPQVGADPAVEAIGSGADPAAAAAADGEGCAAAPICESPAWEGILEQVTPPAEREAAQGLSEDATEGSPEGPPGAEAGGDVAGPGEGRRRSRPRRRRRRSSGGGNAGNGGGAPGPSGDPSGPSGDA
jgi:cell fate regulator YaaT (PSP1 superfamily)